MTIIDEFILEGIEKGIEKGKKYLFTMLISVVRA